MYYPEKCRCSSSKKKKKLKNLQKKKTEKKLKEKKRKSKCYMPNVNLKVSVVLKRTAPTLWNSLPASVRDIDNFLFVKRTIKTYLFWKAFSCYSYIDEF